jgi:hypothetical protein
VGPGVSNPLHKLRLSLQVLKALKPEIILRYGNKVPRYLECSTKYCTKKTNARNIEIQIYQRLSILKIQNA